MLNLNMSPMVKGILIGVGVSAVGFYAYKHNEEKGDKKGETCGQSKAKRAAQSYGGNTEGLHPFYFSSLDVSRCQKKICHPKTRRISIMRRAFCCDTI